MLDVDWTDANEARTKRDVMAERNLINRLAQLRVTLEVGSPVLNVLKLGLVNNYCAPVQGSVDIGTLAEFMCALLGRVGSVDVTIIALGLQTENTAVGQGYGILKNPRPGRRARSRHQGMGGKAGVRGVDSGHTGHRRRIRQLIGDARR